MTLTYLAIDIYPIPIKILQCGYRETILIALMKYLKLYNKKNYYILFLEKNN